MTQTLFVSDLHLDQKRPHIIAAFCHFLQGIENTDALYILGDLFESWIGDDDPAIGLQPVIESIRQLSLANVPVYFIHGNRDFLIGKTFENLTQCKILQEETVVDLYGTPALVMHGDTLCTDDIAYQKYRARVRNRWVKKAVLMLSVRQRLRIAQRLRDKSIAATQSKQPEIMDVNLHAVRQTMLRYGVKFLIHGHTHRPAIHDFTIDGNACRRIVLGDWYEQGSVLKCTPEAMHLETLCA
ncbi:MAG: UDP-2,3-diacylglucosamine diphosphatase [Gammaproteobacteria bacterium]|nr:UDP-2,3-diacylglucosamine diphosphatase [Gammaproteobacteria bacterium]